MRVGVSVSFRKVGQGSVQPPPPGGGLDEVIPYTFVVAMTSTPLRRVNSLCDVVIQEAACEPL